MCTRRARPRTAKRARWFYLTLGAGLTVVCSTVMRANPIGLYAAGIHAHKRQLGRRRCGEQHQRIHTNWREQWNGSAGRF